MADFNNYINTILAKEGGYVNDKVDRGGKTKFGISQAAYPNLDIANLTLPQAVSIYKRDYWDKINGDRLPESVALNAFDAAVNQGVGFARSALNKVGYDNDAFTKERLNRYSSIVANDPSQKKFLGGWMNRLSDVSGKNIAGNFYKNGGSNDPMAMMANYKPRRDSQPTQNIASNGFNDITSLQEPLLSNPKEYAKKAFIEDMVASVPQQDPYTTDLEMKLSKMFDETEILPKEYMNG
jgi:Glycosyl hydrolase 108